MAEVGTLGELLAATGGSIKTGPFGTALKAAEYAEDGVPVISVGEVGHGYLRLNARTPRVAGPTLDRLPEYILRGGDVVFARKGAVDRSAWVRAAEDGYFLGSDGIRVRFGDPTTSRFMAFQFQLRATKDWLAQHAAGTTMPSLSQAVLERLPITLPSHADQEAIAGALGALDDKIVANNCVARASLALSDSFYQQEVARTSSRVAIGDEAVTVLGGTPSRSVPAYWADGTVPWIASGKANETRILEPSEWITEEALGNSAAKIMSERATVIAITGATLGQVARLEIASSGNQSLIGIWHEDPAANDWLYFAMRHEVDELLRHATGAAQQHVNKAAVDSLQIPWPTPTGLKIWGAQVRPLLDAAAAADKESLLLARTRDELLPLLMSGRVRVKDAEQALQRAV